MSSKRRIKRRTCSQKRRYETYEEAWHQVLYLYRVQAVQTRRVVYRCQFCNGYHIGRPDQHFRDGPKVKLWRLTG